MMQVVKGCGFRIQDILEFEFLGYFLCGVCEKVGAEWVPFGCKTWSKWGRNDNQSKKSKGKREKCKVKGKIEICLQGCLRLGKT
jgi:hypothetical protein